MNKQLTEEQAIRLAADYLNEALNSLRAFRHAETEYEELDARYRAMPRFGGQAKLAGKALDADPWADSAMKRAAWHRERVNMLTNLHKSMLMQADEIRRKNYAG